MFTDRWRRTKLLLTAGSILVLGWVYTDYSLHKPMGYRVALASPEDHDGAAVTFPLWRVSSLKGPDRYTISRTLRDVPVAGPSEGLSVGDTVSVIGHFRASDSVVEATECHVHTLRPVKEGLSLLALLAGLLLIPRAFAWQDGRVVLRG